MRSVGAGDFSLWVGRDGQADWERVEFSALRSHCGYRRMRSSRGQAPTEISRRDQGRTFAEASMWVR